MTYKPKYLVTSRVRALAKSHGKRIGADFLATLDQFVKERIDRACSQHNGGKITLDQTIARFVGINPIHQPGHEQTSDPRHHDA